MWELGYGCHLALWQWLCLTCCLSSVVGPGVDSSCAMVTIKRTKKGQVCLANLFDIRVGSEKEENEAYKLDHEQYGFMIMTLFHTLSFHLKQHSQKECKFDMYVSTHRVE